MFEIREVRNKTEYNPLLVSKQTPFTQAWFYGEWQEMMGRKVRRFEVKKGSETVSFFQIIKYPLIFSRNLLYIPHGPILEINSYSNGEFLKVFLEKITRVAKEECAVFVRFDFFPLDKIGVTDKVFKKIPSYGYRSSYFQPKFEWVIDLEKTEEEIFENVHPKNRYNIRHAEKKGIKAEIVKDDFKKYFETFFSLLSETAKRDNFNLHPKAYYQNIFATLKENNAFLVIARYGEKILLVNLILLFGETAYFLFGGSGGEYKNLMFSHLAQWEAIKEAKKRGFAAYNFGGVDGGKQKNLGGVSFFKKRFGGQLLEYSDSYDLILKPFWHYLYNLRKWVLNLK